MHRRIRKLRLTCTRGEDARHGRVLLNDALRTASLGDETRLILVRRLDLGSIPRHATATHWSQRIEEAFRATRPVAIRFDSAEAADANAVFFAHRHEPWLALAERTAAGHRCEEWFWRAAVPHWNPSAPAGETLRRCFRALADQGGLALTLVLSLRLATQGTLPALLRCLEPGDVAGLQAELPDPAAAPGGLTAAPATPPLSTVPAPKRPEEIVTPWGAGDLRTRWLAAVAVAREAVPAAGAAASPIPVPTVPTDPIQDVVLQWTERKPDPAISPRSPRANAPSPETSTIAPYGSPPPMLAAPPTDRASTRAGGLFFVIPLLARAGFTLHLNTLDGGERASLPWQVLRLCLRHARAPVDDPLVLGLEGAPPSRERLGRWLLAAHRHAVLLTGLNLRQIIARPALVTLSPTHIDVLFRPADADIRIRSAGLDFDPGWVPSLGRVIAFHFSREA